MSLIEDHLLAVLGAGAVTLFVLALIAKYWVSMKFERLGRKMDRLVMLTLATLLLAGAAVYLAKNFGDKAVTSEQLKAAAAAESDYRAKHGRWQMDPAKLQVKGERPDPLELRRIGRCVLVETVNDGNIVSIKQCPPAGEARKAKSCRSKKKRAPRKKSCRVRS